MLPSYTAYLTQIHHAFFLRKDLSHRTFETVDHAADVQVVRVAESCGEILGSLLFQLSRFKTENFFLVSLEEVDIRVIGIQLLTGDRIRLAKS